MSIRTAFVRPIALTALTLLLGLPAVAAYLENVPQVLTQPDKRVLHCFASSYERFNWFHECRPWTMRNGRSRLRFQERGLR